MARRSEPTVAILCDSRDLAKRGAVRASIGQYVSVIEDVAGLSTRVLELVVDGPRLDMPELPDDVRAVFTAHLRNSHVSTIASLANVPVLADFDTTAIALTAALLTTLTRAGKPPAASRVVVAGAKTIPAFCPLLMTAGIGDLTAWNPADPTAFPLRHISSGADAVVDLLSDTAPFNAHAFTPVIVEEPSDSLLALPGLIRALVHLPEATTPSVDVLLACALALVMATPPDERLPPRRDRALAETLADACARALAPQACFEPE